MNRLLRGILVLTALALPLWIGSCSSSKSPSSPSKPDLTVLTITWTPTNPVTDQPITVSIAIKNTGEADAAASSTRLKVNGTASCASIPTPAIAKGQQATVTCDIGGRAAGTYTLEANVDVAGLIDESDESNNTRTASLSVTAPPAPDLIVQSITFSPNPPVSTEPVVAHIVVHNQGTATAVATTTSSDTDGTTRCPSILTQSLPAGGSVTVDCDFGELEAGPHIASARADAGEAVSESNETNNSLTVDFTVNAPNTPDLIVEGITFTPAQPTVGEPVTAHAVIRNQGTGPAPATVTSTELDGSSACPTIATAAIPAGETVTVDCALGTIAAGSHPVLVCADAGSTVTETREDNNCLTVNVEVNPAGGQPDLIVQEITFTPDPPVGGQDITAHILVKNQGTATAGASNTTTELDSQSRCDVATPLIPSGQTATVDCDLGILSVGSHTVRACADHAGVVTESNENNNCTERTFEIAAELPDLVIDGIVLLPASPTQGQPVTAQVTVRNAGGTLAAGSMTRVRLDGATTCAEIGTSSLPAGNSVIVSCNLGTPSTGHHTVEACADITSQVTEADENNNCATDSFDVSAATSFPAFPIPDISTCVDFQSQDPNALSSQQLVQMNLNVLAALASLGNAFLLPLEGAQWTDQGGGCWTWNYDNTQGCTGVYRVCQNGAGWEWTLTLNGNCGQQGAPYVDWVAFRATMDNADGTIGTLRLYASATTTVETSWTWNVAADRKSGAWNFYDGDVSSGGTLSYQITWAKNVDNSQDTSWIIPDSSKTETHVSADCRSGYYRQFSWLGSPAAWVIQNEITWDNGHGSNKTYDDTGQEIVADRQTW